MNETNVIRAFSADHVARLTGLTKRQLAYWDRTGFFEPQHAFEDRRIAGSRVYSFRDVVGLRVLGELRNKYNVPLQQLRKVAEELGNRDYAFWAEAVLYVVKGEVAFHEPETRKIRSVVGKQYIAEIPLKRSLERLPLRLLNSASVRATKLAR